MKRSQSNSNTSGTEESGNNSANRRSFLGGLAGFGSPYFGWSFGRETIKSDDTVTIPIVEHGDEILHREVVPREWWEYIENVKRLYRKVESKWKSVPGVKDVNRVASKNRIRGRKVTKLNVEVNPVRYSGGIPERVNGVDVQISEWEELIPMDCGCISELTGKIDNIAGGVAIKSEQYMCGTSCCRIWTGSEYQLLTANHLFSGDCSNTYGDSLYQHEVKDEREIGQVATTDPLGDVVTVDNQSDTFNFTNQVYTNDGKIEMLGAVTNYDWMMTEDETILESTGATTGYSMGKIMAYPTSGEDVCYDFHDDGVRTHCSVGPGDSGGPCYYVYDNGTKAALAHVSSAGKGAIIDTTCKGDDVVQKRSGLSSAYMSTQYGWKFGSK